MTEDQELDNAQELESDSCNEGFCGIGEWRGTAEVFDGSGRFVGNGADQPIQDFLGEFLPQLEILLE